jgi:hypothetical protein
MTRLSTIRQVIGLAGWLPLSFAIRLRTEGSKNKDVRMERTGGET